MATLVAAADDLGHFPVDHRDGQLVGTDLLSNDSDQAASNVDLQSCPSPWPEPAEPFAPAVPFPAWQPAQEGNVGDFSGCAVMVNGGGGDEWPRAYTTAWMATSPMSAWRNWSNRQQGGTKPKRRFCTLFPDVGHCRRGSTCSFAHSREELPGKLFEPEEENQDSAALTDEFFMYKYKTRWCPIGVQHEWHTCVYAHNYQDARRPVSIGYGAKLCPYWSKKVRQDSTSSEYSQRCPLALRCPYSHGAKEQLYHPNYFKTVVCRDVRGKACPRSQLCAFWHSKQERRQAQAEVQVDYSVPLKGEAIPRDWADEFLSPPFIPEGGGRLSTEDSGAQQKAHQNDGQTMQYSPQNQDNMFMAGPQPMVFMMPMPMGQMPAPQPGNQWVFFPMDNSGNVVNPEYGK